ncbi:uncharacterized protein LOC111697238 isoform X2 [Eurytemora carolleeae]|nr:uncharacterized protein LOC111697238 isoform X2 [Eurytemora carolleeae]|eukprot:XP_023322927.1 uncharacterized protein LOC111697238 isoform X2 [Eurytemora affinis]
MDLMGMSWNSLENLEFPLTNQEKPDRVTLEQEMEMDFKRRAPNFSKAQTELLLAIIEKFGGKDILTSGINSAEMVEKKKEAWIAVHTYFIEKSGCKTFTVDNLKVKYKNSIQRKKKSEASKEGFVGLSHAFDPLSIHGSDHPQPYPPDRHLKPQDLGSSCEGWEKFEEEEGIEELEIEEDDAFEDLQTLDQYLKYPNQNQIKQNQINQKHLNPIQISQNQINHNQINQNQLNQNQINHNQINQNQINQNQINQNQINQNQISQNQISCNQYYTEAEEIERRKRAPNFSAAQSKLLQELIENFERKDIIHSSSNSSAVKEMKNEAWTIIHDRFKKESGSDLFSVENLRGKYRNTCYLKKKSEVLKVKSIAESDIGIKEIKDMAPQATLSDTGGDMVPQDILSGSEDGDTVLDSTVSDPEDGRLETELDPSLLESEDIRRNEEQKRAPNFSEDQAFALKEIIKNFDGKHIINSPSNTEKMLEQKREAWRSIHKLFKEVTGCDYFSIHNLKVKYKNSTNKKRNKTLKINPAKTNSEEEIVNPVLLTQVPTIELIKPAVLKRRKPTFNQLMKDLLKLKEGVENNLLLIEQITDQEGVKELAVNSAKENISILNSILEDGKEIENDPGGVHQVDQDPDHPPEIQTPVSGPLEKGRDVKLERSEDVKGGILDFHVSEENCNNSKSMRKKNFQINGNIKGMLKTETEGVPVKQFKHNKELFSCDKCEYVTLTQIALLNHMKTRHERGRPTCVLCGLMFKTKFDLARHRRQKHWNVEARSKKVTSDEKTVFLCELCAFTTDVELTLKKHKWNKHLRVLRCDLCSFKCHKFKFMNNHKAKQHGISFPCDECKYTTLNKYSLKLHKDRMHGAISFFCDQCEYSSTTKLDLFRHYGKQHQGKTYPCDQCDFVGSYNSSLFRHVQVNHKGVRYSCEECNLLFTLNSSLKKHIKSVHLGIKIPCDQCDMTFSARGNMLRHKRSKHGAD